MMCNGRSSSSLTEMSPFAHAHAYTSLIQSSIVAIDIEGQPQSPPRSLPEPGSVVGSMDDIVKSLRRMTYSKRLQKEYKSDKSIVLGHGSKSYLKILYNRNNPKSAVEYFDRYLHLEIPANILRSLNEEEASQLLFDIANLPLDMVTKRLYEEYANKCKEVDKVDESDETIDYDIAIREDLEFEAYMDE